MEEVPGRSENSGYQRLVSWCRRQDGTRHGTGDRTLAQHPWCLSSGPERIQSQDSDRSRSLFGKSEVEDVSQLGCMGSGTNGRG